MLDKPCECAEYLDCPPELCDSENELCDSEVAKGWPSTRGKVTPGYEPKKKAPLTVGGMMRVVDRGEAKTWRAERQAALQARLAVRGLDPLGELRHDRVRELALLDGLP